MLLNYDGPCQYLHGHNYTFTASVEGNVDSLGFVVDFKDLRREMREILLPLDHAMVLDADDPLAQHLRHAGQRIVLLSVNPTAENFAFLFFNKLQDKGLKVATVRVQETSSSYAEANRVDRQVKVVFSS